MGLPAMGVREWVAGRGKKGQGCSHWEAFLGPDTWSGSLDLKWEESTSKLSGREGITQIFWTKTPKLRSDQRSAWGYTAGCCMRKKGFRVFCMIPRQRDGLRTWALSFVPKTAHFSKWRVSQLWTYFGLFEKDVAPPPPPLRSTKPVLCYLKLWLLSFSPTARLLPLPSASSIILITLGVRESAMV